MPKFTHQTAVISMAQFITIMLLGVPNTLVNIISTCHSDSSNCVSNMIVSIIFYILTAGWFGIIMILGYTAQKKRSRQFAVILIGFEVITLGVALYIDFPHDTNWLAKTTSLIDGLLSVWVIYLAFRLFIAGNKRIVRKQNSISRSRKAH